MKIKTNALKDLRNSNLLANVKNMKCTGLKAVSYPDTFTLNKR